MTAITITRYTAVNPKRLSKRFTLDPAGDLRKESGGNMLEGVAERLTLEGMTAFADLLPTLRPNQATGYGINGHDRARVVVADRVTTAPADDLPIIARTRDFLHWPDGPGILMLDYDPAPGEAVLSGDALLSVLATVCPPLAAVPRAWRPSASSCIFAGDRELKGIAGQRIYVAVADAQDIPRAGQVLVDRLWLAGQGYYLLSKSGAFLARTLIDAGVFQPERLDFAGGADCGKGLEQRLPEPLLLDSDAPFLDTRAALPDLDAAERQWLADLRERMKEPLREQQWAVRANWIESRVADRLSRLPEPDREPARPALERVYRAAAEGGRLGADFELTVVVKGAKARKVLTVAALLKDPEKYHEAKTLDPLEPDYPNGEGRQVGWVNLRAKEPYLQSHAHGGTRYLLEAPAVKPRPAPDQETDEARAATIQIQPGRLPEITDEAEAGLLAGESGIFQRSGYLCRIAHHQAATVRGVQRPANAVTIAALDVDFLLDVLNRRFCWARYDLKQTDWVTVNAPRSVATTLLARSGHWRFPVLVAVVTAPTLRPDGSILEQPGYDSTTGLFFDPQGVAFPPIPKNPTKAEARKALDYLIAEVLNRPCVNSDRPEDAGFSFAAPSDRSAALAAVLTGLARQSLPTAPAFLYDATRPGSAKTLLANTVALIATGRAATVFELGDDPDEIEKRLLAVLLAGDPIINLDNLEQPLGGSGLCKTLTAETITGRILGLSKNATVPTITTWVATGNNVGVVGDMTRRTVVCSLDPQSERPESRQYDRNLADWIPENRAPLVVAGLTVLRGYIAAGRPRQPYPPMGSFEEWDNLIRRALTWLGEPDPLAGTARLEDADPTRQQLRALLLAWYRTFKTAGATCREAIAKSGEVVRDESGDEVRQHPALFNVLMEYFTDRRGELRSQSIGDFIKKYAGRLEIGARFENFGSSQHAQVWRVKVVNQDRFQKFLSEGEQGHQGHKGHGNSENPGDPRDPRDPFTPHRENLARRCVTCSHFAPTPEIGGGSCGYHQDGVEYPETHGCDQWERAR